MMYSRSISPGANSSGRRSASVSRKRTFSSPAFFARSIARIIASGTRSTARYSVSGIAAAVSAVKRPFPQPSST